jgi:hypothetical protein
MAGMTMTSVRLPLAAGAAIAVLGEWSLWWLDGRSPSGPLDPPVRGRFENGIGTFHGETTVDAKQVGVRFLWSQITPASARWEQAYSPDGGKTWDGNWVMEFRRAR